ncbi:hypothetical protein H4219_003496 [Mycoemilia scoparia]|uniref:NmrA-like domain-containing protein n=1 Tax=Mycoemilia scoparia TaxID=417184 RepID=A0A9W8DSU8_9FUNG|nr:hypothetical protein H4219_003496 [Mycoemilia scoparia]
MMPGEYKPLVVISSASNIQSRSVINVLIKSKEFRLRLMVDDNNRPDMKRAQEIKAKHPDVELFAASLNKPETLYALLKGASIVFGIPPLEMPEDHNSTDAGCREEFVQGKNLVDAAVKNKVQMFIWSSLDNISEGTSGKYTHVHHFDNRNKVEQYISSQEFELPSAFIHPGFYYENFPDMISTERNADGKVEFLGPLDADYKLPMLDPIKDIGPTVMYIIKNFDECRGEAIDVAAGYYSTQDVINAYTEVTGIPAVYRQISLDELDNNEHREFSSYIAEYGFFFNRVDFMTRNKVIPHDFTTPIDYWKNYKGPKAMQ